MSEWHIELLHNTKWEQIPDYLSRCMMIWMILSPELSRYTTCPCHNATVEIYLSNGKQFGRDLWTHVPLLTAHLRTWMNLWCWKIPSWHLLWEWKKISSSTNLVMGPFNTPFTVTSLKGQTLFTIILYLTPSSQLLTQDEQRGTTALSVSDIPNII